LPGAGARDTVDACSVSIRTGTCWALTCAHWSLVAPQIVCVNTAALLFAGRFGLAPTVNKNYGGSGGDGGPSPCTLSNTSWLPASWPPAAALSWHTEHISATSDQHSGRSGEGARRQG